MKTTVVLNLVHPFHGVMKDVYKAYGNNLNLVVLALRCNERERPTGSRSNPLDPSVFLLSDVKKYASRIVFVDDEGFDARALGTELGTAIILTDSQSGRGAVAAVRIYDGLKAGQLVELDRDVVYVLEQK